MCSVQMVSSVMTKADLSGAPRFRRCEPNRLRGHSSRPEARNASPVESPMKTEAHCLNSAGAWIANCSFRGDDSGKSEPHHGRAMNRCSCKPEMVSTAQRTDVSRHFHQSETGNRRIFRLWGGKLNECYHSLQRIYNGGRKNLNRYLSNQWCLLPPCSGSAASGLTFAGLPMPPWEERSMWHPRGIIPPAGSQSEACYAGKFQFWNTDCCLERTSELTSMQTEAKTFWSNPVLSSGPEQARQIACFSRF